MCDYSLHAIKNRLAVEGELLVVHKFHTGSKGLSAAADLEPIRPKGLIGLVRHKLRPEKYWDAEKRIPAVCVPPGARLRLDGIPRAVREKYGVGESEEVTFTQVTAESFRYRDAFRFDSGCEVLVQKFPDGLRVEVLSLALVEEAATVVEKPAERRMSANA